MTTGSSRQGSRVYRKRRRAELELETRRRITEATVKLHGTVGPAQTTVSGIADEAGVQRATVYRHFPDGQALFDACTAHFYGLHPMPDIDRWASIADPDERMRRALADLYAWYAGTEDMLTNTQRDVAHVPPATRERFLSYFRAARDVLVRGRRERGRARARAAAAIGHAIAFRTWQSLVREQGLADAEAVELMARMVAGAGLARSR
ncbi:MAG TPA: helix-turn-helix domain-containing protein [Solirubrobacterales bacterium]|jgi:AcrR family transcriptional regulator